MSCDKVCAHRVAMHARTTDTQWRHKSKISEKLGRCGRQNMLRPYLNIWEWEWIFGRAVKATFSPGVRSPWSLQRKWFSWQNIGNSLILNDVYITLYVDSLYNMFYLLIEYADKNSEGPFITMHTLEFFNTFWIFEFYTIICSHSYYTQGLGDFSDFCGDRIIDQKSRTISVKFIDQWAAAKLP